MAYVVKEYFDNGSIKARTMSAEDLEQWLIVHYPHWNIGHFSLVGKPESLFTDNSIAVVEKVC